MAKSTTAPKAQKEKSVKKITDNKKLIEFVKSLDVIESKLVIKKLKSTVFESVDLHEEAASINEKITGTLN